MNITFDEKKATPLCSIMGNCGSDKGRINIESSWHNYTTLYYELFKSLQNDKLRIFELGLGTNNINIPSNMGLNGKPGASLYGWSEFFINSDIFGADIDREILFNTNKIKTFYCDQTNPQAIKNLWENNDLNENFDIIIEDGLHTFEANVIFFENSIHKLNPNGYYIIEDINIKEKEAFEKKIQEWKCKYENLQFSFIEIPSKINKHDNNLLIIKNSLN
jgi:hypothetical protein